ncbi:MAG: cation diffusion facilitator family transporter [Pseudomonadota bacterium]|nr:cation diffusion facilitator family transporter [Pseudomonadota bacterium]
MIRSQEKQVIYLGMGVNIILIVAKLVGGLLFSSLALVADGIHSISDLITDFIILWGLSLAARPADKGHPYGHGKLETMASLLVAALLFFVSFGIMKKAFFCFLQEAPHIINERWVIAIALLSMIGKEFAYRKTINLGTRLHSPALQANAWHHRSDALSSMVVLIGALAGCLGWTRGDPSAGFIVGMMIAYVAFRLTRQDLGQLLESAISPAIQQEIEDAINRFPDIISWHQLRTRQVGREIFLDFHILVDGNMRVVDSHNLSHRLEGFLKETLDYPLNIIIHIEPGNKN